MEDAFYTIGKYAQDPSYQPTDAEVAQMANFVVTHGGRAILNDVILRGYIYALGGYFKGEVHAESGVFRNVTSPHGRFKIDSDGYLECQDAKIRGNLYTPLFIVNQSNYAFCIQTDVATQITYLQLAFTGLNVQIEVNLPTNEAFLGARANILNNTSSEVFVVCVQNRGTGRTTGRAQVLNGTMSTYICFDDGGTLKWLLVSEQGWGA